MSFLSIFQFQTITFNKINLQGIKNPKIRDFWVINFCEGEMISDIYSRKLFAKIANGFPILYTLKAPEN